MINTNSTRLLRLILTGLIVMVGVIVGNPSPSHALLITTEFVFIGPKDGVSTFVMKNTEKERRAFRMDWKEVAMGPDGRRIILDTPEQVSAVPGLMPVSPYLYVAPRRMMIQPGQVQSIRFMARRTQNMPDGEYRSYVEIIPEDMPDVYQGEEFPLESNRKDVSISMKMLSGLRVPVFLLQGNTTLDVSFENVYMKNDARGNPVVYYTLVRDGTRSALGETDVRCMQADGREKFLSRGTVKVFQEINRRELSRNLDAADLAQCASGLVLNFTPHKDDPAYAGQPMASAEVSR